MADRIRGRPVQLESRVVALFTAIQSAGASRWMPDPSGLTTVHTVPELRAVAEYLHPDLMLIEMADALGRSAMAELSMTVAHTAPVPVLLLTQFRLSTLHLAFELTAIRTCRIIFYECDDVRAAITDALASGSAATVTTTLLKGALSTGSSGDLGLARAVEYALVQSRARLSTTQFARVVGKSGRQVDRSLTRAGLPSAATICRIASIVTVYRHLQVMSVKAATTKLGYRCPSTLRRYLNRAIGRSPSDLKRMPPATLVDALIQAFALRRPSRTCPGLET
jgi:hypothetical protein